MSRLPRTLALILLGALLLLGFLLPSGSGEPPDESIVSTEPEGWRAAYLLLDGLGFEVEEWRRPPDLLPEGGALLILPRAPAALASPYLDLDEEEESDSDSDVDPEVDPQVDPGDEDGAGAEDSAESSPADEPRPREVAPGEDALERSRLRTLRGYRTFVEGGGVLLLADGAAERELLRELDVEAIAGLEFGDESAAGAAHGDSGTFELDGWKRRGGPVAESTAPGVAALLQDDDGHALAWRVAVGAGEVAWLASDAFVCNDALGDGDHGRLLVRLVEELAGDGPVWFDEYAAGRWSPGSVTDLVTGATLGPLTGHVLLLALLAVWLAAWAADFPRDPPPLARLSPLARAEALAALCVRGRRESLLGDWLRAGVWSRLVAIARAPRDLAASADASSVASLETLLAARGLPAPARERLRRAFTGEPCEDREALDDLGARLREVEADVVALAAHDTPRYGVTSQT